MVLTLKVLVVSVLFWSVEMKGFKRGTITRTSFTLSLKKLAKSKAAKSEPLPLKKLGRLAVGCYLGGL